MIRRRKGRERIRPLVDIAMKIEIMIDTPLTVEAGVGAGAGREPDPFIPKPRLILG
jgi:hypothetical protein